MANTHKLESELQRIRRESDGLLILLILPNDGFIYIDPRLAPKDAIETLRNEIPALAEHLQRTAQRAQQKPPQAAPQTLRQKMGEKTFDMLWGRYQTGEEMTGQELECLKQEGLR